MSLQIQFVDGIESQGISTRDKELADSRKRAHSARYAYLQKKARLLAKKSHSSPHQITQSTYSTSSNSTLTSRRSSKQEHAFSECHNTWPSTCVLSPQPQNNVSVIVGDELELRAMMLWNEQLAHLLARYASPFEVIYTGIIPRLALMSSTVRDMLNAVTSLHENLHHHHSQRADIMDRARLYYSKGLKAMRKDLSPSEMLAAARLACCYEALQDNWKATMIHTKGCGTILKICPSSTNGDLQTLLTHHRIVISFYASASNESTVECADDTARSTTESISQARIAIVSIIRMLRDSINLSDDSVYAMQASVQQWRNTFEDCNRDNTRDTYRDCLLLLVDLATAMLPEYTIERLPRIGRLTSEAEEALREAPTLTHVEELLASLLQLGLLVHESTDDYKGWAFDFAGRVKALQNSLLFRPG